MRPLLAVMMACVILGGLKVYMKLRDTIVVPPKVVEEQALGVFSLDVTLSFRAEPDTFALNDAPTVLVRFRGQDLLKMSGTVEAGEPLVVEKIANVVEGEDPFSGRNEFYFKVLTGDEATDVSRAIRVRVFRDGVLMAEGSAWSDPGEPVEGVLLVVIEAPEEPPEEHEQDPRPDSVK